MRRTDQDLREMHAQALQSGIIHSTLVTPLIEELLELRAFARGVVKTLEKADAMEALFVAVFQENLRTTAEYRAERAKVKIP